MSDHPEGSSTSLQEHPSSADTFVTFLPLENSPDNLPSLNQSFFSISSYGFSSFDPNSMPTSTSTFSNLSFSSSEPESPPPPMIPSFNSNPSLNGFILRKPSQISPSNSSSPSSYFYSPTSDVSSVRTPQSHFNLSRTLLPRDVSFMDVFAPKSSPPNFMNQVSTFLPPTPSTLNNGSASVISTPHSTPTSNPQSPASPQSAKSVRRGFKLPEFSIAAPTPELSPTPRFQTTNVSPSPGALSPAFVPAISRKTFLEPNGRSGLRSTLGKRTFGMRRSSSFGSSFGLEEAVKEEESKENQLPTPSRSKSEPFVSQIRNTEFNLVQSGGKEKGEECQDLSSEVKTSSSTPSTPRRPSKSSLRPKSIRRVSISTEDGSDHSGSSPPKPQLLGSPINLTTNRSFGLHQLLDGRSASQDEMSLALEKKLESGAQKLTGSGRGQSATVLPAHPPRMSSLNSPQGCKGSPRNIPLKRSNSCFSESSSYASDLSNSAMILEDSASLRAQVEARSRTLRRLEEKAQDHSAFSPDTSSSQSVYSTSSKQSPFAASTIVSPSVAPPTEEQQLHAQLQGYRMVHQSLGTMSNRSSRSSLILPPPKPRPQVGLPPIPTSTPSNDSKGSPRLHESRSESLTQLVALAGAQLELVEAARALEKQRKNSQIRSPSLNGITEVKNGDEEEDVHLEDEKSPSVCSRPRSSTIDQITRRCFEPPSSPPVKVGSHPSKKDEEHDQSSNARDPKRSSLLREILLEGSRSSWWRSETEEETHRLASRDGLTAETLRSPTPRENEPQSQSQAPKTPSGTPQVRNLHSSPSLQNLTDYRLPSRQRSHRHLVSSDHPVSRSPHPFTFSPARKEPNIPKSEELESDWENVEADPRQVIEEDQRSVFAVCGKSSASNLFQLFKSNRGIGKKRKLERSLPSTYCESQVKCQASSNVPRKPLLITAEIQVITKGAEDGNEGSEEEMEVLKPSTASDGEQNRDATQEAPDSRHSVSVSDTSHASFSTPTLGPLFFMDDPIQSRASLCSQTDDSSTHTLPAKRSPDSEWAMTPGAAADYFQALIGKDRKFRELRVAESVPDRFAKFNASSDSVRTHSNPLPSKSPRSRKRSTSQISAKRPETEQFYPILEGPFKYQDMMQMSKALLLKGEERREREQTELENEEREKRIRKTSKKSSRSLLSKSSNKTSSPGSNNKRKEKENKVQIGIGAEGNLIELEMEASGSKSKRSFGDRRRKQSNLSDGQKSLSKKNRSRSRTTGATDYKFEKKDLMPLPPMPLFQKAELKSNPSPQVYKFPNSSEVESPKMKDDQVSVESRASSGGTPPGLSKAFWSSHLERDPLPATYSPTISISSSTMDTRSVLERKGKFSSFRLNPLQINSVNFPKVSPASPSVIEDQFHSFTFKSGTDDSTAEDFASARGSFESQAVEHFRSDQTDGNDFALMALRALSLGENEEE